MGRLSPTDFRLRAIKPTTTFQNVPIGMQELVSTLRLVAWRSQSELCLDSGKRSNGKRHISPSVNTSRLVVTDRDSDNHALTEIRRFRLPRRNSAMGQGLGLAAVSEARASA